MEIPDSDLIQLIWALMFVGGLLLLTIPDRRLMWVGVYSLAISSLCWALFGWYHQVMALTFMFGCITCLVMGQAVKLWSGCKTTA